ncbi:hypothetical protein QJS64_19315 (plasmid) [Paraclostridium bifermentans]|uniref:Uncharacterized protein n=1 Tax=Paraclostridium bifermentans TaxID=1490 RepID=A0ABY8R9T4_PARBF|nr:hypothetical protein QJS64_19315 [Paraclostridium bifermentans]
MDRDTMIEFRELLLSLAETVDGMVALEDKGERGEEVDENEVNALVGKFMLDTVKLNQWAVSNG